MDYTGLSLEEYVKDPTGPIHPEDIPRVIEKWLAQMAIGEGYEEEMRLRRADGEYRWFLVRTAPLRDDQGNLVKWYGVSIDIEDRKQAEEALKESQRRLEEAQRIAHVGHWDRDLETGLITWSDEIYRILGLLIQEGDSLRTEWLDVVHPEDRRRLSLAIEELERGIQRLDVEFRIVRPNGEVRFLHSQGDVIRDERGRPLRRFGTAQDITERRSVEDELKKEKEILEKIFDNIPVMIGFVGADGRVKMVNPEWERTIGWTLKELEEQNVDIFTEAYPDPSYRQEILDFVAAATGEWVDLKIRVRDGRVIDAACAVVHLSDGTKVAIAQDITERKEAEQRLKHSETQLAEAQRLANVGGWDWDLRSNTVTWSEELYRIFGLPTGQIKVAGDAMSFIHPEDRDLVRSTRESAVRNKKSYSFHYRVLRPDGEERIVHSRGSVLCDNHGEPIRVFGATQDVTELKRAEEKLKATTAQLRALSASLQSAREAEGTRIAREIHDELGGALTSLKWDLESFDKVISESNDPTLFQALHAKVETMLRLSDTTISAVRRISSELRPSVLDDLGLAAAIEWQAQQFQARTGIICHCELSVTNVDLDREQSTAVFRILQEALTNVLRHAQATRIDIAIREEAGEFVLTVSDNGKGITEDDKSRLQSLGLLGMRERAHLIGGEIDITGVEAQGTVVTVRVPNAKRSGDPSLQ
jgi:PAS domain S-box-containing protein